MPRTVHIGRHVTVNNNSLPLSCFDFPPSPPRPLGFSVAAQNRFQEGKRGGGEDPHKEQSKQRSILQPVCLKSGHRRFISLFNICLSERRLGNTYTFCKNLTSEVSLEQCRAGTGRLKAGKQQYCTIYL